MIKHEVNMKKVEDARNKDKGANKISLDYFDRLRDFFEKKKEKKNRKEVVMTEKERLLNRETFKDLLENAKEKNEDKLCTLRENLAQIKA